MLFSFLRIATLIVAVVADTTVSDPSTTSIATQETVTVTTKTTGLTTTPKPKGQFPYVVSIGTNVNGYYQHLCVGVIISKENLLSAAHCVKFAKGKLYVVGGSDRINDKVKQRFVVVGKVQHPRFKILGGYDIVVLKVSPKFPLDDVRFKAISFEYKLPSSAGLQGSLVGWGRVKIRQRKMMQQLPFRTIDNRVCKRTHGFRYLASTDICAVHLNGPQGACDGDSGAPLVNVAKEQLYGLLSYGKKACQPLKPYAFTRVSLLSQWIKHSMRSLEKSHAWAAKGIWKDVR